MSADMYAWEPSLDLDPKRRDFGARVEKLCDPKAALSPTPAMRKFIAALLARYPDLSDDTEKTIWADGPLLGDVCGSFVNVTIQWDRYQERRAFFLSTAASFHLNAFDPQDGSFFPAGKGSMAVTAIIAVGLAANEAVADRRAILRGGLVGLLSFLT